MAEHMAQALISRLISHTFLTRKDNNITRSLSRLLSIFRNIKIYQMVGNCVEKTLRANGWASDARPPT